MALQLTDVVAAVASPPGAAVRGIIRISGDATGELLNRLLDQSVPASGLPVRRDCRVSLPDSGVFVPGAVQWWPGRRSYTGQPMAELHLPGSAPVLDLVMAAVCAAGARPAERGEFTMRAFLNGRIDLLQAEAVTAVIDAADHDELQVALTQLGGGLTSRLQEVRSTVIAVLGDLEAGLDFVEEDIEFISAEEIIARLGQCLHFVGQLIQDANQRLPSGYRPRVVLAGLPNAGKSTLFNSLTQSDAAIASEIAGTTRDYLSAPLLCGTVQAELVDTAGAESGAGGMQQMAQTLGREQWQSADLILWCSAADLSDSQRRQDAVHRRQLPDGVRVLPVTTCVDRTSVSTGDGGVCVSAVDGTGVQQLRRKLENLLGREAGGRSQLLAGTSARCRDSLSRTQSCLEAASASARSGMGDEITAISLREALAELRAMLGETWTDDILDHVFSTFCIGK